MDNLSLLKFCQKNPEKFLDPYYMFVEKDQSLGSYTKKTKEIKELLVAIKRVQKKKKGEQLLDELFQDLQKSIKRFANYSEFGAFINACDAGIKEPAHDLQLLKKITNLYLQKRDLTDIVPAEWIQALVDKGASRKKGHAGEKKLIDLLVANRFVLVKTQANFKKEKKAVAKFSNKGEFTNKNIAKTLGVSIGQNTQGKKLDLVIKRGGGIYFLEAKHLNTGGGGQSKQVLELIEIIRSKPSNVQCHFVAFLDGWHSNSVLSGGKDVADTQERNKVQAQYRDLVKALRGNKVNYWVNSAGFKKLFVRP